MAGLGLSTFLGNIGNQLQSWTSAASGNNFLFGSDGTPFGNDGFLDNLLSDNPGQFFPAISSLLGGGTGNPIPEGGLDPATGLPRGFNFGGQVLPGYGGTPKPAGGATVEKARNWLPFIAVGIGFISLLVLMFKRN